MNNPPLIPTVQGPTPGQTRAWDGSDVIVPQVVPVDQGTYTSDGHNIPVDDDAAGDVAGPHDDAHIPAPVAPAPQPAPHPAAAVPTRPHLADDWSTITRTVPAAPTATQPSQPVQVIGADRQRRSAVLVNVGTVALRIGRDSQMTDGAASVSLPVNGTWNLEHTAAVWIKTLDGGLVAGQVDVVTTRDCKG